MKTITAGRIHTREAGNVRGSRYSAAWLCFWLSLLCGILSFAYFTIKGHGILSITSDFNVQQIPFTFSAKKALSESGLSGFAWDLGLGTSTLQGFSFYDLGSVTFWISWLFPMTAFPYLTTAFYIAKYVLAAMLAFFYLCRFVREPRYAVLGGLLYAFSGYQAVNLLFYHFHDVTAIFPLLLIGMEKVMAEEKNGNVFFILAVFLNAITNYFFFIHSTVFLVIYFIIRFHPTREPISTRCFFRYLLRFVMMGALGVGMASVLFIPSVSYAMHSNRIHRDPYSFLWGGKDFIYVLKCLILPPEALSNQSIVYKGRYDLASCYLPMFGWSLCLAYISKKKKDWLSILLVVLVVCSLSPFLTSMFLLFSNLYFRWWYALVLMMVLASVLVAEQMDSFPVRKMSVIMTVIVIVFYAGVHLLATDLFQNKIKIVSERKFLLSFCIAISGYIIVFLLTLKEKQRRFAFAMSGVILFSFSTTAMVIHFYRSGAEETAEDYQRDLRVYSQVELQDPQYRISVPTNMNMLAKEPVGCGYTFCSTLAGSVPEYRWMFDYNREIVTVNPQVFEGLSQLVGEKYYMTQDIQAGIPIQTIKDVTGNWYVMEKEAAPIGFAVDRFMTGNELKATDAQNRARVLMCTAVVKDDDAEALEGKYRHVSVNDIDFNNTSDDFAAEAKKNKVNNFARSGSNMTFSTDYDSDKLVSLTISYDGGWSATMDGKPIEIIDEYGLMLIKVPAGHHELAFHYKTPLVDTGIAVSLVSWGIFVMILIGKRQSEKRMKIASEKRNAAK